MDNAANNDDLSKKLEQVAEGFAIALVTAQLIDEQMEENAAATHQDIERLAVDAASGAGSAIDKAKVPGSSAV